MEKILRYIIIFSIINFFMLSFGSVILLIQLKIGLLLTGIPLLSSLVTFLISRYFVKAGLLRTILHVNVAFFLGFVIPLVLMFIIFKFIAPSVIYV